MSDITRQNLQISGRSGRIRWQARDHVGSLVLHHLERHNALDHAAWDAIPDVIGALLDAEIRVLVLSGAGGTFCAGADISEFDTVRRNTATARAYEASNNAAFTALRDIPLPTIAMIRGACLGGGFGLAAACDLRFADVDATFSVPAAKLGLAYPADAIGDIVEAVGAQMTKQLLYTAARFGAADMERAGFISETHSDQALDIRVDQVANEIAALAPLTHRATKAAVRALRDGDMSTAAALGDATFESADYAEGRAAFREKRRPLFTSS